MWVGGTTCCAAAESLQAASLSTGRVGPCRVCAAPFWLMMPAESTASKTDEGRRARNILVFSPNRNPLHDSRLLRLCAYLAGSGWAVRLMWVQGSIDRIPILPVYAQACPCVVPGRFFLPRSTYRHAPRACPLQIRLAAASADDPGERRAQPTRVPISGDNKLSVIRPACNDG